MGYFTALPNTANQVYLKRATVAVTASSVATGLYAANVAALPVSLPWKPTGALNEGAGNAWVELDFGTAISADFCAVINHRVTDPTLFDVRGGSSANPSDFAATLPHASRYTSYVAFESTQTYRYWRINVDDDAAGGDAQIGYIALGMKTVWSFRFPNEWRRVDEYSNRQLESEFGVPMVGLPVVDRRRFFLRPSALTTAERAELLAFLRLLEGSRHPAVVVPDPDTDAEAIFGRIAQPSFDWTRLNKGFADLGGLEFVEDNCGFSLRYEVG